MSGRNGDAIAALQATESETPVQLPLPRGSAPPVLGEQLALPEPQAEGLGIHSPFSSETMLQGRSTVQTGWRRLVYRLSAGRVVLAPSPGELRERELVANLKTPIRGC